MKKKGREGKKVFFGDLLKVSNCSTHTVQYITARIFNAAVAKASVFILTVVIENDCKDDFCRRRRCRVGYSKKAVKAIRTLKGVRVSSLVT